MQTQAPNQNLEYHNYVSQQANAFFAKKLEEKGIDPSKGFKTPEEKTFFEEVALQYLMAVIPHDPQYGLTYYIPMALNGVWYTIQYTNGRHIPILVNPYLVVLFNGEIIHTDTFNTDHPLHKLACMLDCAIDLKNQTATMHSQMVPPIQSGYQPRGGYGYSQHGNGYCEFNLAIKLNTRDIEYFIGFDKKSESYVAGVDKSGVLRILGINGNGKYIHIQEGMTIESVASSLDTDKKSIEEITFSHSRSLQNNDEFTSLMKNVYGFHGYNSVRFYRFTF